MMNLENYLNTTSLISYPIVFIGGILASLTPCVYPMIPVVIGIIGGQATKTKSQSFFLSCFYVLGLAIIYSGLGAFAALTGQMFGKISTNPYAFFLIGNLCILFGLNMFEVFNLPSFLFSIRVSSEKTKTKNMFFTALLMGLLSGVVMSPCTAPVLGVLLAYVATKHNVFFGMSLLFTFSLGLGMLLMVIGTFTGILSSLPKSGEWMLKIKHFFGWLMLGMGEYFLISMGKMFI